MPQPLISKNFFSGKGKCSSNPGGKSGLPATTALRCAAASGSTMPRMRVAALSVLYKNITAKATSKRCPCCWARVWSRFIRRRKNRNRPIKSPLRRPFRTRICTVCLRICSKRAGWMPTWFLTSPAENCSTKTRRITTPCSSARTKVDARATRICAARTASEKPFV